MLLCPVSISAQTPEPLISEEITEEERLLFRGRPSWVPARRVPLAGSVVFSTTRPCRAAVRVAHGDVVWTTPETADDLQEFSLPVVGLKPDREYQLTVLLSAAAGMVASPPLSVRTPPLPADFPALQLVSADRDRMEPGLTLFSVLRWEDDAASVSVGWFLMVDDAGEVVWYLRLPEPAGSIRRLPNGNLMFLHGARPTGLREIDLLGNVVHQYRAVGTGLRPTADEIAVPVDTFHHDCHALPGGDVLVLTTEVRRLDRFPVSESRPQVLGPAHVVGDVVVQLRPDGEIVQRWPLLDILDPTRIGYGSLDSFWDLRAYPFHPGGTRDWSHANSVAVDPADDGLVVCLRHQDAVVKFDRRTSEIRWILGTPAGWQPPWADKLLRGDARIEWPFHAHGVKFTPQGTLLLFDNGNCRRMPPERPQPAATSYSRAVEYAIDEANRTVRQVWEYGSRGRDRFFSAFVGDVDHLPATGNRLICDGGRLESRTGAPLGVPPGDVQWGRIVEVTGDSSPEVVFELHVREPDRRSTFGSSVYRSKRVPDLRWWTGEPAPDRLAGEQLIGDQ